MTALESADSLIKVAQDKTKDQSPLINTALEQLTKATGELTKAAKRVGGLVVWSTTECQSTFCSGSGSSWEMQGRKWDWREEFKINLFSAISDALNKRAQKTFFFNPKKVVGTFYFILNSIQEKRRTLNQEGSSPDSPWKKNKRKNIFLSPKQWHVTKYIFLKCRVIL